MRQINTLILFTFIALILIVFGYTRPILAIRGTFQNILKPIVKTEYSGANSTVSAAHIFFEIGRLSRDNADLAQKNANLESQLAELKEVRVKVATLEKELGLQSLGKEKKIVAAAVVGRSPSSYSDVITIDKGSDDGLAINQPVLSNGFLIGRISQVLPGSSQIELITSHRFLAPVTLQDSRGLGLLRGGLKGLQVEQLPIDVKINPGEVILTSGIAGGIPQGIPVGKVKEVLSKPSDIFQIIDVETPANLSSLEIVLIVVGKI